MDQRTQGAHSENILLTSNGIKDLLFHILNLQAAGPDSVVLKVPKSPCVEERQCLLLT